MFKKTVCIILTLFIIIGVNTISIAESENTNVAPPSIEGESPYLIVEFSKPTKLDNVGTVLSGEDIKTLCGTYVIGNETITFTFNNIYSAGSADLIQQVESCTKQLIDEILKGSNSIFPDYNNINVDEAINSIQLKKIVTTSMGDIDIVKSKLENNNEVTASKCFEKVTFVPDVIEDPNINTPATISSATFAGTSEPKGGKSFDAPWFHSAVNPYKGDRQDRLGLKKRTDGAQYNWLPNQYWVDVFQLPDRTDLRRQVNIGFQFDSTRLGNLNIDDNETFEAEVSFYNYGYSDKIPNGHAYIYDQQYMAHNIPSNAYPYLDTRYLDKESKKYIGKLNGKNQYRTELEEVSYCVGVADTRQLSADTKYWCVMQGYPYHYYTESGEIFHPDSGRAKLTFQRGYNYVSSLLTSQGHPSNGHDEWSSFNEEYEMFIRPLTFSDWTVPSRHELTIDDDAVYLKRSN